MNTEKTINRGIWTQEEHDRFLQAIRVYPQGPWRMIAKCIGTRSVRQVQTHAQKYHEKILRRVRGLSKDRKTWARSEHRIDDEILALSRKTEARGDVPASILRKLVVDTTTQVHSHWHKGLWSSSPVSPISVDDVNQSMDMEPSSDTAIFSQTELPTLSESLDFLIEHFCDWNDTELNT